MSLSPRIAAEWEPVLGAIVGWPLIVPEQLIIEITRDHLLYVLVSDALKQQQAKACFRKWGIDLTQVEFVTGEQGLGWAWPRDWGPFALYTDQQGCRLVGHHFASYPQSGPGYDSNIIPDSRDIERYIPDNGATHRLAKVFGLDTVHVPVSLTGGNFLVDGHGTAFSTCIIQKENRSLGWSDEYVTSTIKRQLGISRHIILPCYEKLGIQHLDCALKLLDEETLLVIRVPTGHPAYRFIEEMTEQLQSQRSIYGRSFKILRIDTGYFDGKQVAAYTNALIFNQKVLVPLYGIEEDEQALQTWQKAMPGFAVFGFESDIPVPHMDYTGWQSFDSLHCRVRAVWDPGMLHMTHRRIADTIAYKEKYHIYVTIRSYCKANLIQDALQLRYRRQCDKVWRSMPLVKTELPDVFESSISGFEDGETVEYYLSAADQSGREESLPRSAPDGWYIFTIQERIFSER